MKYQTWTYAWALLIITSIGCSEESTITDNPTIGGDATESTNGNGTDGNNGNVDQVITNVFDEGYIYSNVEYPVHYNNGVLNESNEPANNRINDAEANLGRVLFYDVNLSVSNTVSCASCHLQSNGFTDPDQFSMGHEGGQTGAHSMRLGNIALFEPGTMFWDRRAMTLEEQVLLPIQDAVEMGFDQSNGGLNALIAKLSTVDYYPDLFDQVYGNSEVTVEGVQRSLAQFVRSMVSVDSKFDRGYAQVYMNGRNNGLNNNFPNFTASENRGKGLFLGQAGCDRCHDPVTFALGDNARGNGLDAGESTVFKSPSLKNVGITGPYMHDGRFDNLMQVIEHYNSGIQAGPALDNRLREGRGNNVERLNLSEQDKLDLVAFLHTLTDENLISDPKFSDPFN